MIRTCLPVFVVRMPTIWVSLRWVSSLIFRVFVVLFPLCSIKFAYYPQSRRYTYPIGLPKPSLWVEIGWMARNVHAMLQGMPTQVCWGIRRSACFIPTKWHNYPTIRFCVREFSIWVLERGRVISLLLDISDSILESCRFGWCIF